MVWSRAVLTLLFLLGASVLSASATDALAGAVRAYYDEGASVASERFFAILEQHPGRGDAAWWLARCQLDLGAPDRALELLEGRQGENIPAWRFLALEAHAAALLGQDGRALDRALEATSLGVGSGDSVLAVARAVAVALSARAGDDAQALAILLAAPLEVAALPLPLRAALPELDGTLPMPLAPGLGTTGPLLFEALGGWWELPAGGGLARRAPRPDPVSCGGLDLCHEGRRLLEPAGVRFTPSHQGGALLYAAGREPLDPDPDRPGLFRLAVGASVPERLTTAPEGTLDLQPVAGGDAVLFLRQGAGSTRLLRLVPGLGPEVLAPDLEAVSSLAVVGDRVVLTAVVDGAGMLRTLPLDALPEQASEALVASPVEVWAVRSP